MTDDLGHTRNLDLSQFEFEAIELDAAEIATDAILIVKTMGMGDEGNKTRLVTRMTNNTDFITYRGMAELFHDGVIENAPPTNIEDSE
jgi:hypothetical protein